MGCDIHLRVEKRRIMGTCWTNTGFYGEFYDRNYPMFARMAGVRDYYNKKMFEPRGLPPDISHDTVNSFIYRVTNSEECAEWNEQFIYKTMAEQWVEDGISKWWDDEHKMVSDPDLHSHSWLTAGELRQCYDDCLTEHPYADFSDWCALVAFCEGIEQSGNYECRVVFAFDN